MTDRTDSKEREAPDDGQLVVIYKQANGEDVGKAQPLTTKRIINAMRAAFQAGRASLAANAVTDCARCGGSGEDPEGFYDQSRGDAGHTQDGPCRTCNGSGVAASAGSEPVTLDHIACIEDGELRYMTGRKAPAYDCELYAMSDGKCAPPLYLAAQAPAPGHSAKDLKKLRKALIRAQQAINSMKVEAETAAQGDKRMMLEACETISNEGLQADMAIRDALAAPSSGKGGSS